MIPAITWTPELIASVVSIGVGVVGIGLRIISSGEKDGEVKANKDGAPPKKREAREGKEAAKPASTPSSGYLKNFLSGAEATGMAPTSSQSLALYSLGEYKGVKGLDGLEDAYRRAGLGGLHRGLANHKPTTTELQRLYAGMSQTKGIEAPLPEDSP